MSSNPFRRSRVPVDPDPASASVFDTIRDASDAAAPTTPSTKTKAKRVVIQTPPHSPEEVHNSQNGDRRLSEGGSIGRTVSPPPVVDTRNIGLEDDDSESDAAATGGSGVKRAGSNTGNATWADAAPGATKAPYNPFARTLASQETGLSQGSQEAEMTGGETRSKPTLDVDAFKNILMNGAPVPAGLSTTPGAARVPDSNSSSTDTSSVFERSHGPHPESPQDDFHDYESASDEDDNEHSGLMGVGRSDDLAPPAPPKSQKGPLTVSFADFDQSIPPGFMASGPRTPPVHTQHITGILRSASPRPGSDLNKPLPMPPGDTGKKSPSPAPVQNVLPAQVDQQVATVPPTPKAVPPPPPTRKSGAGHGRARSGSNPSNMTLDSSIPTPADSVVSTSSNKLAPPPPPARKSNPSTQPAPPPPPKDVQPTSSEPKLAPPPPPLRRHPSKASKGSSNVSRQASDDSTTASRSAQVPAAGAAAPPPPPPRRLPGSKRTSLDGPPSSYVRKLSGEHHRGASFDSERSASISSLQKVAETGESNEQAIPSPGASQSKDILAEMSAFQAEIDALTQASKGK
ncbi:hypothetical protein CBER1_00203 [Cercospora berteroae]|uniref:Uncharacterized protein n=1 Tax=Cercospora berteroae TaxID=357750 RepID=A0A2S6CDS3_9PEZI|nr:hypothetical protein CBER1_00203 [Cercospora berteroae]